MYLTHFGLDEPPFRITPHTDFFFEGANRGATLEALVYAITHGEGIVKVSGEVGSGKTMLCRVLIERLPKNVETIYLASPSLSRDEILHAIADDLHITLPGARTTVLIRALQDHLIKLYGEGRRVVILIDEAHAMPLESLEEVRLLSNLESSREKLLQIVLFGQPELDEHLNLANMRQLRERITHSFRLEPLVRSDVASYMDFRLRHAGYRGASLFSPQALRLIASASQGLTRRINILADKAMLAAYADGANHVSLKHARAALRDAEFAAGPARARGAKAWLGLAGVAAGLALGFGAHWLLATQPGQPAAPTPVSDSAPTAAPSTAIGQPAASVAAQAALKPGLAPGPVPAGSPPAAMATQETPRAPHSPSVSAALAKEQSEGAMTSATSVSAFPAAAAAGQPVPPASRIARERFSATQLWLRDAPGSNYSLQLAIFNDTEGARMENFLRQATESLNPSELYVYSVKVNGQQHYRIAYGAYATVDEIRAALDMLPAAMKAQSPFYRTVGDMRRLNQAPEGAAHGPR